MAALDILAALAALASIVSGLKNIFDDPTHTLDQKLDEILRELQQVKEELIQSTVLILEAIDGISRQINREAALTSMAEVDRALFSDLAISNNKQLALGESFEAANHLFLEPDIVFTSSYMYVVSIRLAVVKDFDPNYFCKKNFQQEFQDHIGHLRIWIAQINDLIVQSNTVDVQLDDLVDPKRPEVRIVIWVATYFHNGVFVSEFRGPERDATLATRARVEQQANALRSAGIADDRQQSGVIDMEKAAAAWEQAFTIPQRMAMVSQVLNRHTMAIDFNPDGLMVDGRILPVSLDVTTLMELLVSREFRNRVQKAWDGFMNRSDDRLVQFAHRRLFNRDTTSDEIALLHGIASRYGYAAFIAALLYSKEYEEQYGRGFPVGEQPITDALKFVE
jgi:hypothetical protein